MNLKLLLLLLVLSITHAPAQVNVAATVDQLLDRYIAYSLSNDTTIISPFLTPGYTEVISSGFIISRKQLLNGKRLGFKSIDIADKKVNSTGDRAFIAIKAFCSVLSPLGVVSFSQFSTFSCQKGSLGWQFEGAHHSFDKRNLSLFNAGSVPVKIKNLKWNNLLNDNEGDGRIKSSADGKSFSYYFEQTTDSIWFKLEQYNPISITNPAVSVSIDIDLNQDNGVNWYGTNTAFRVDKMLSVGLLYQRPDLSCYGYNGITNESGIVTGTWLNELRGNITFFWDEPTKSYFLGIKRSDISHDLKKFNVIGSVGQNAVWNDDISKNGEFATVDLKKF